jgi:hypothetical protein
MLSGNVEILNKTNENERNTSCDHNARNSGFLV